MGSGQGKKFSTKTSPFKPTRTDTELTHLLAESMGWVWVDGAKNWFICTGYDDHEPTYDIAKQAKDFIPLHPTKGYNDVMICWRELDLDQKYRVSAILMEEPYINNTVSCGHARKMLDATPRQIALAIIAVVEATDDRQDT